MFKGITLFLILNMLLGCSSDEDVGPEASLPCINSDAEAGSLQQENILGTWKNVTNYSVGPGDLVERTITFSTDYAFESFSITYNGCPYSNADNDCDDWYSSELTESGRYSIMNNVVVLDSNEGRERLLIRPSSENILISIGESCDIDFTRT